MYICINQCISNIWGSIHQKLKQHCTEAELRKDAVDQKACINFAFLLTCHKVLTIIPLNPGLTCNYVFVPHCDTDAGTFK